jgi:capsular polysaccharide export protein
LNQSPTEVVGIKPWKRWQIDRFLRDRYGPLHYAASPQAALRRQARHGGRIVIWAAREPEGYAAAAAAQGAALVRMEDGFLRSVGLGSTHVGGASLVVDESGIYFDPRSPSALEQILQQGRFDTALLERAAQLRQFLVGHGLTKYNVGTRETPRIEAPPGRRRILVPGQVENDASIRHGAPGVHRNLELLQQVRAQEPEAWLVYKPHPDTEAGTRPGAVGDAEALRHADQVVRGVSATALFPQLDAVHTMTSLLGFEALLRGIPVTTWGLPFYAGWGLTEDRLALPRRSRRLQLDELVAGALILYPLYTDPLSGQPCQAEDVARQLAAADGRNAAVSDRAAPRIARLCLGLVRSWMSAHAGR